MTDLSPEQRGIITHTLAPLSVIPPKLWPLLRASLVSRPEWIMRTADLRCRKP